MSESECLVPLRAAAHAGDQKVRAFLQTRVFLQLVEDPGEEPRKAEAQPPLPSQTYLQAAKPDWHPNRWYTRLHR